MLQNKPVLMLHEIDDNIFKIDLEKYILTFDDGLYSQYMLIDRLCEINTPKYFFISTNIVCDEDINQSTDIVACTAAHQRHFNYKINDYYMKWSDIKDLKSRDDCYIGGHGHTHACYIGQNIPFKHIIQDTNQMLITFKRELNYSPRAFCYPYNYTTGGYSEFLRTKGIHTIFGSDRLDCKQLLSEQALYQNDMVIHNAKWNENTDNY